MSDVCLLLEGTYPYVAGGVSSWVNHLVHELKDISFSIVYLGAHRGDSRHMHYSIPSNVTDFREIYLFDYRVMPEKTVKKPSRKDYHALRFLLSRMKAQETACFDEIVRLLGNPETRSISLYDLAHSYEGWKLLRALYEEEEEEVSFLDYFWTWRFLYLPFFSLLKIVLPSAGLYHSVSTGYAGVLGALAKYQTGRPFLLTEHGIYTRERKIEISKADWIYSENARQLQVVEGRDFFRDWWISLFTFFSRLSYDRSDEIITLYEANRRTQIEEGAPSGKIRIIPNGVFIPHPPAKPRRAKAPFCIGFVGRVVPIKDVKTFLMACKKIKQELKDVEIEILGPLDEDESYYRECLILSEMEGLSECVHFRGKVNMKEHYPKLDVIVLTSISEAQPLVILEAGVHGIPVVATDVGSCRELLYGRTADDALLGQSGIVTPVRHPEATADGVIHLLKNPMIYSRMSRVAVRRISAYYNENDLLASYENLYHSYTERLELEPHLKES